MPSERHCGVGRRRTVSSKRHRPIRKGPGRQFSTGPSGASRRHPRSSEAVSAGPVDNVLHRVGHPEPGCPRAKDGSLDGPLSHLPKCAGAIWRAAFGGGRRMALTAEVEGSRDDLVLPEDRYAEPSTIGRIKGRSAHRCVSQLPHLVTRSRCNHWPPASRRRRRWCASLSGFVVRRQPQSPWAGGDWSACDSPARSRSWYSSGSASRSFGRSAHSFEATMSAMPATRMLMPA